MSKLAVSIKVGMQLLLNAHGRRAAAEALAGLGFQYKHTPWGLVSSMVDKAGNLSQYQSIMVLFNIEFLEELYDRGYDMSKVVLVADTPLERLYALKVYKVGKVILAGTHTWSRIIGHKKQTQLLERLMKMNAPADVTFSNPPYNGGLDLKIILALFLAGLLKRLVCVHPSTWLVDVKTQLGPKSGNPLFRKFQDAVRNFVTRVELFNGNPVFGIGLYVPCVITEVDMTKQRSGAILVQDVGVEGYREVLDINDITLHGSDWDPTVKEFMGRVQRLCAQNDSLGSNVVAQDKSTSQFPVQLAAVRGHEYHGPEKMVQDDFYTFVMKNPDGNRGVRKADVKSGNITPVLEFTSIKEQDNFLDYLQTDFARMCLALLKIKQHLYGGGEMSLVPWLDFTRSWDDDQLFTMLGYPRGHAIREYAKRFLPDYHNIYPNGKTY